jgi:hypothetical protein
MLTIVSISIVKQVRGKIGISKGREKERTKELCAETGEMTISDSLRQENAKIP